MHYNSGSGSVVAGPGAGRGNRGLMPPAFRACAISIRFVFYVICFGWSWCHLPPVVARYARGEGVTYPEDLRRHPCCCGCRNFYVAWAMASCWVPVQQKQVKCLTVTDLVFLFRSGFLPEGWSGAAAVCGPIDADKPSVTPRRVFFVLRSVSFLWQPPSPSVFLCVV